MRNKNKKGTFYSSFFIILKLIFLISFKRLGALPLPFNPTPLKNLWFLRISQGVIYKLISFSCSFLPNGIVTGFALTMLIGHPQTARKFVFVLNSLSYFVILHLLHLLLFQYLTILQGEDSKNFYCSNNTFSNLPNNTNLHQRFHHNLCIIGYCYYTHN